MEVVYNDGIPEWNIESLRQFISKKRQFQKLTRMARD
jgi:hypothetical protein